MLKVLMLRRSIDAKKVELAELERKDAEFLTREAEIEAAINEVEPGNAEQEAAINAEIEKFDEEKSAHEAAKQQLSADIEGLEAELEEIERSAPKPPSPETHKKTDDQRGESKMETINIRALPMTRRAFDALPLERRNAIVAQDDVKCIPWATARHEGAGARYYWCRADYSRGVPGPDCREHVPVLQASEPGASAQHERASQTDYRRHCARGRMDRDVRCHQ